MNWLNCEVKGLALPRRRLRIEVDGGNGEKVSVTIEGSLPRRRLGELLDLLDLIGRGTPDGQQGADTEMTKFEKLRLTIDRRFPGGWFTSQDAMIAYEDVFDEPLGLSTVSTYLSRLVDQDVLVKSGSPGMRRYRKRISRQISRGDVQP